jgi:hypothetical protein
MAVAVKVEASITAGLPGARRGLNLQRASKPGTLG